MPEREEATHKLVPLPDAQRLTGLGRNDLVRRLDTQHLVSIDPNGKRGEFLLVPIALLGLEPEDGRELSGEEDAVVSLGSAGAVVRLSNSADRVATGGLAALKEALAEAREEGPDELVRG